MKMDTRMLVSSPTCSQQSNGEQTTSSKHTPSQMSFTVKLAMGTLTMLTLADLRP